MAKSDKKRARAELGNRFRIPWFVIVLLILGSILGGGAVFQKLMLIKDAEAFPAPGIVLKDIRPVSAEDLTDEAAYEEPDAFTEEITEDPFVPDTGEAPPETEGLPETAAGVEEFADEFTDAITEDPLVSDTGETPPETEASPEPAVGSGVSMHAFVTGNRTREGQPSVLLLGGWETASPVVDYEPLIARLKDYARVITIERPGYGWSGGKYSKRTLDNMLGETRAVLEQLQETGPYVIVAHTTAGLEAIHFASKYNYDVAGIVFINAMAPAAYSYRINGILDFVKEYSFQVPKYTGIFRAINMFAPQLFTTGPNVDTASYAAMYLKNVMSSAMRAEAAMLSKNAKTALLDGIPDVPATAFVDTKSYNANPELSRVWSEFNAAINANVIESDVGSYIHGENTGEVAAEILRMAG